jgi:predicted HTH transcriptional regulator
MPSNAVAEAADLLRARIRELDEERAKLERALASLTDGREGRRGPGRPRGSGSNGVTRRRRRRRGGTRAEQAVKLISENPGINASEIARRLGIKPNYMYRVLTELQNEGKVRKEGRAYHPVEQPGGAPVTASVES